MWIYIIKGMEIYEKRIIAVVLIIAIIQSFGMCVFANTIDELKQQKKRNRGKAYRY